MGLFDFGSRKPKAPSPAAVESLPTDLYALLELGKSHFRAEDCTSAVLCFEKLVALPLPERSIPADYDYAAKILAECYAEGKGCLQDMEKAKAAHSIYVKCVFANGHYSKAFEILCSSFCNEPEDYKRIFCAAAEGWGWIRNAGRKSTHALFILELLRGLIHLSESGMKYAVGKEAILNFLDSLEEPEDGFWKDWPNNWGTMTPEEMRPFIKVDNYLHIEKYDLALLGALKGKKLQPAQRDSLLRDMWKQAFPDAPALWEQKQYLAEKFEGKYGGMTAQELLDSLYADEAAWQAAHSAETKAAETAAEATRVDEEERVARRERLYRDGLLYCGLGDEEQCLTAMEESAELGNHRAGLWLLKRSAQNGSADAYCMLGDLSMQGAYGMVQDELAAYGYYLAACRESGKANAALSAFHRSGIAGVDVNEELADGFFAASVELGYGPSCLKQADLFMREEDWDKAESVLKQIAAKTGDSEADESFAALAALADFYQRKGDSKKALEYAIRFADLDYAQDPEDKGWQQYRSGVLNGEEKATYEMYRFYCLYHSSGPAKRNEDNLAAPYIRGVGLAFSAAYCDLLRARHAAGGYDDTVAMLFTQLLETDHEEEALQWADRGLKAYNSHMCYLAATLYADELDVDEDDAIEYLKRGSIGSGEYGKLCKEALADISHAQREAWKQERKLERARRAQEEAQRQALISEKMNAFRSRMDLLERDIDRVLNGSGYTVDEYVIRGDISAMDGLRHRMLREMLEEKAHKKYSDI